MAGPNGQTDHRIRQDVLGGQPWRVEQRPSPEEIRVPHHAGFACLPQAGVCGF